MTPPIKLQLKLNRSEFALQADITVPGSGITVLYGPSGAGKSTLLRVIAGLEQAQGSITVAAAVWQDENTFLPTHKRRCGYVFQEPSLFEHLTVQGNLEYGLQRAVANGNCKDNHLTLQQIVKLLALQPLLQRRSAQLSGGERQRVAIGRALLSAPQLLLLDEPLAALDQQHKRELLPFLDELHRQLDIPVIYVTHSPDEVARLADHLVLINDGRAHTSGPVNEVLTRFDLPIAHDYDAAAVVTTQPGLFDEEYGLTPLAFSGGTLLVPGELSTSTPLRVRVLARDISLTLDKQTNTSILNIVPALVTELTEDGPASTLVKLDANGTILLARITRRSASSLNLTVGLKIWAQIKTVALLHP